MKPPADSTPSVGTGFHAPPPHLIVTTVLNGAEPGQQGCEPHLCPLCILTAASDTGDILCPHFTDEETEAQRLNPLPTVTQVVRCPSPPSLLLWGPPIFSGENVGKGSAVTVAPGIQQRRRGGRGGDWPDPLTPQIPWAQQWEICAGSRGCGQQAPALGGGGQKTGRCSAAYLFMANISFHVQENELNGIKQAEEGCV